VAVTDIVASRAQAFATKYNCDYVPEYAALLDRSDIDVITLCVPSGLHAPLGIEAANAGKHVLTEKPIALTLADADALIEACSRAKVKLSVVLQNRYNPPMLELRQAVDAGRLGQLHLGTATVRWFRPQDYYEDGWHGTRALDGGALMNQAIHHIDALQWFMGPVESVFAFTATRAHTMEMEDVGVVSLRFKNGALGSIEASTLTYPENLEGSLSLFGEKGSVKIGGTALNRTVFWKVDGELEHEREKLTRQEIDPPTVYGYSHRAVLAEMSAAIREDRSPAITGETGRESLALVLSIYQSALSGQSVRC
jgi:predicted dehydrogenase